MCTATPNDRPKFPAKSICFKQEELEIVEAQIYRHDFMTDTHSSTHACNKSFGDHLKSACDYFEFMTLRQCFAVGTSRQCFAIGALTRCFAVGQLRRYFAVEALRRA